MKLLLSDKTLPRTIILGDRVGVRMVAEGARYVDPGLRETVTCEAEKQRASG